MLLRSRRSVSPTDMIAPCGMNCTLCIAHQREANRCPGCRGENTDKPHHCVRCSIKTCRELRRARGTFCFECAVFPCRILQRLDERYIKNYGMSMIANLHMIKSIGAEKFTDRERKRWQCRGCGGTLSVHRPACQSCGALRAKPVKRSSQ